MSPRPEPWPVEASQRRLLTLALLLLALGLRVAHLVSSVDNPFFYALSPDEQYYLAFARAVAGPGFGLRHGFEFMDPLYGYVLGALVWLSGANLFLIRCFQILVDTASVYLVLRIGATLWNFRAGLVAGALYAGYGPAIFYSCLLLKTTLVTHVLLAWVLLALRSRAAWRPGAWMAFGLFTGLASMLRSNFILLGPAALAVAGVRTAGAPRRAAGAVIGLAAGAFVVLAVFAWRHQSITGEWAWLPSNGGIVLYQVYNPDYLQHGRVMPRFVYSVNPTEMQFYFVREAERRTGTELSLQQTNRYWGAQAGAFVRQHPRAAIRHLLQNLKSFFSGYEVPNNRSFYLDRLFSAVLAAPLVGFPLAMGFGLVGLTLALRGDARVVLLWVPLFIVLVTCTVFFDFSRFRFPAVAFLLLGAAAAIEQALGAWRGGRRALGVGILILAAGISLASWQLGRRSADSGIDWAKVAEAEVKSGQFDAAEALLTTLVKERPDDAFLWELLGYMATERGEHAQARRYNDRALALDPRRHVALYNLSLNYQALGDPGRAEQVLRRAIGIRSLPAYRYLLATLIEAAHPLQAAAIYRRILAQVPPGDELAGAVRERLEHLGSRHAPVHEP